MSIEKLGQEPAMPYNYHYIKNGEDIVEVHPGMSKRLLLAGMMAQGYLQSGYTGADHIVKLAFELTDKILEKENE